MVSFHNVIRNTGKYVWMWTYYLFRGVWTEFTCFRVEGICTELTSSDEDCIKEWKDALEESLSTLVFNCFWQLYTGQ